MSKPPPVSAIFFSRAPPPHRELLQARSTPPDQLGVVPRAVMASLGLDQLLLAVPLCFVKPLFGKASKITNLDFIDQGLLFRLF